MKIAHVSRFACPRILKLATVQARNHEVGWIGERQSYQSLPFAWTRTPADERFGGMNATLLSIDFDLVHVHTHITDSSILENVLKATNGPVVWDCHDAPVVEPEKGRAYRVGPVEELGEVYRTYCPKEWFAHEQADGHFLVIASGLSDRCGTFRYWYEAFRNLKSLGRNIRAYSFSKVPMYEEVCDLREPIPIRQLIVEMSHATAGICGSPYPDKNMLSAMPNKLFEYLASGIPVICFGSAHRMADFVREYEIGVVVDSATEMISALETIGQYRANVLRVREQFTMDEEAKKVMAIYERLVRSDD